MSSDSFIQKTYYIFPKYFAYAAFVDTVIAMGFMRADNV